ncbi:MAG: hypothetical protein NWR99_10185 [Verrucomicrobiales bacterium]|jgi:hypothetical protein|nr:hypothetical protein [Verrucomicrobiales bacterium]
MNDTTKEAEQVRLRVLRTMSPTRRLTMALGWSQSVRELSRIGLRKQFPHASEQHLRRLMAERVLGTELALRAYGPLNSDG